MDYLSILAVFAILLQVLDGISTVAAINSGHGAEGNPVVRWLMNIIGVIPAMFVYKTIASAGIVLIALAPTVSTDIKLAILGAVSLCYTYVVYNNYRVLKG